MEKQKIPPKGEGGLARHLVLGRIIAGFIAYLPVMQTMPCMRGCAEL